MTTPIPDAFKGLKPGESAVTIANKETSPIGASPESLKALGLTQPAVSLPPWLVLAGYVLGALCAVLPLVPPLAPFAAVFGIVGTTAAFFTGAQSKVPDWLAANEVLLRAVAPTVFAAAGSLEVYALTVPGAGGHVLHVVAGVLGYLSAKFMPLATKR